MADMRLVVMGAGGRMGRALVKAITEADGVTVCAALERAGSPALGKDAGDLAGVETLGVPVTDDALAAVVNAEGIVDFTAPSATIELAALAAQARIAHIIGTTGLSEDDLAKIAAAARHAPLVRSGNMSLGVNVLAVLVQKAAAALGPEWDIEILEMHHRMKVDAPSGTAILLGEAAARGRAINLAEHSVRSRDGHTGARKSGDIGFATLRGGSVIGEHSVMLATAGERITLSHHAEDRSLFANGAIKAALGARGRKPGQYSMLDVLGLND